MANAITTKTVTISALAAAEAKAEDARAKLADAEQAYRDRSAAAQAAVDADREMRQALNAGRSDITEEQIIEAPANAQAAVDLANAAKTRVHAAKYTAGVAEHELIAHKVHEQAAGFVSADSLRAEVDAVVAEAVAKLDDIADRMDDRNSAIDDAIRSIRQHDGGQHDPSGAPIAGVRRVLSGYDHRLEVDGEVVQMMTPSLAAYGRVADGLKAVGHPESRATRANH